MSIELILWHLKRSNPDFKNGLKENSLIDKPRSNKEKIELILDHVPLNNISKKMNYQITMKIKRK